jgi:hypothetical protein
MEGAYPGVMHGRYIACREACESAIVKQQPGDGLTAQLIIRTVMHTIGIPSEVVCGELGHANCSPMYSSGRANSHTHMMFHVQLQPESVP